MFYSQFIRGIGPLLSCGALLLCAATAHGQTCSSSYEDAQQKEQAGHLIEARELYSSCAKSSCGAFLLSECTTRHARLDSDIPSVVPVATHKSGRPYQRVQVTLDGEALASSLNGRSVQVDPGWHEFVFTTNRGVTRTERVLILQGDRNRRILATLAGNQDETVAAGSPEPPAETESTHEQDAPGDALRDTRTGEGAHHPSPTPSRAPRESAHSSRVPALSWLLGGVGVLGGGGYFLFSTWAKKDNQALAQQCAPACQQSSVDGVKQRFLAADISLGVGIVGLSSAVLVYALSGRKSDEPSPSGRQAYAAEVRAVPAGALASVSGSF